MLFNPLLKLDAFIIKLIFFLIVIYKVFILFQIKHYFRSLNFKSMKLAVDSFFIDLFLIACCNSKNYLNALQILFLLAPLVEYIKVYEGGVATKKTLDNFKILLLSNNTVFMEDIFRHNYIVACYMSLFFHFRLNLLCINFSGQSTTDMNVNPRILCFVCC